eukprot:3453173-Pyramimonas_sp.AAC.1
MAAAREKSRRERRVRSSSLSRSGTTELLVGTAGRSFIVCCPIKAKCRRRFPVGWQGLPVLGCPCI